jgi:hypothetical protein
VAKKNSVWKKSFIHQAVLKWLDDIPALTTNLSFTALNCNKENEGE